MELGKWNHLTATRFTDHGCYLMDAEQEEVLLPNKYVPEALKEGQELDAFVYRDSGNRPVATTLKPKVVAGEFGMLEVVVVTSVGAFVDWGLEKDLLIPFSEQKYRLEPGQYILVYVRIDPKTSRLVATTRVEKYFEKTDVTLEPGQEVDLLVGPATKLGIQVVVDQKYLGMLYDNELFQAVSPGEKIKGWVRQVRPDGKVDVILQAPGYARIEPAAQKILDVLNANGGFLALTDRSEPVLILARLEMSKKTFKQAVGSLYKQHLITIGDDGIRLTSG